MTPKYLRSSWGTWLTATPAGPTLQEQPPNTSPGRDAWDVVTVGIDSYRIQSKSLGFDLAVGESGETVRLVASNPATACRWQLVFYAEQSGYVVLNRAVGLVLTAREPVGIGPSVLTTTRYAGASNQHWSVLATKEVLVT
jgi:hypothetical protein